MANLNIKDVPRTVHERLKKTAKAQGRSLNSYVISVLKLSAEEQARRERMRKGWKEYLEFMKSLPPMGDSTSMIREDRERDHGHE